MKKRLTSAIALVCAVAILAGAPAQAQQTEEEFQKLRPVTGTVDTFFEQFNLDHSFPAVGEAEKIYDLMDHQRAAQLYLWGIPLVGMTRWHEVYKENYKDYDYNTLISATRFNERRGILTANETTDYFFGFSNTRESAVVLEIPSGLFVGMIDDMWQQSRSDVGVFGPNAGGGGTHVIVGPSTPADKIDKLPDPADGQRVHRVVSDRVFYVLRAIGTPDEVKALSAKIRLYNYGDKPTIKILDGEDKFTAQYQPRGLAYWEMLHRGINDEDNLDLLRGVEVFLNCVPPASREATDTKRRERSRVG